jgi:hypothetical protein
MKYLLCVVLLSLAPFGAPAADELRFEIPTLPGFQRHAGLLEHPGYIGVLLENNDLPPTLSSKIVIGERGREAQAKSGIIRFTGKSGTTYNYEGGVSLGIGKAAITVPATVDISQLAAGRIVVAAKLPLANLLSDDKRTRIEMKVRALANTAVQQRILDYLDAAAKRTGAEPSALFEAILLDSYNRSGGAAAAARADIGDAVPISEQWMLLVTLAIWFILVPAGLLVYKWRRRRSRS